MKIPNTERLTYCQKAVELLKAKKITRKYCLFILRSELDNIRKEPIFSS
jgi:hypothetical protein